MIPVLLVRYMFIARKKRRVVVNYTSIWLIMMLLLTTINGIRLQKNASQFSILYNTSTFLIVLFIQMIFQQYKGEFLGILKVAVIVAALMAGSYIFAREINMLMYRWKDFLSGNSGYRLGVSSNINPNTITWTFGMLALFTIIFAIDEKKWRLFVLYAGELVVIFFTGSKNGLVLAFLL